MDLQTKYLKTIVKSCFIITFYLSDTELNYLVINLIRCCYNKILY